MPNADARSSSLTEEPQRLPDLRILALQGRVQSAVRRQIRRERATYLLNVGLIWLITPTLVLLGLIALAHWLWRHR